MTLNEYNTKRGKLYDTAQQQIADGHVEDANATMEQITQLDAAYAAEAAAQANLSALNSAPNGAIGVSAGLIGNSATDGTGTLTSPSNDYGHAFYAHLTGRTMTDAEAAAFARVNPMYNSANTAADNTVLIPEQVQAGIWQEIGDAHPLFGDLAPTYVNADLKIIKESTNPGNAEWLSESDSMTDTDLGFGTLILGTCELAKCISVSWALKTMAYDDFMAYITRTLADKMGGSIAGGVATGKGIPGQGDTFKRQPVGIITALKAETDTPQIVTYDDETGMSYDDIVATFATIKSGYTRVIYASNLTIWTCLAKIKDTTGRPLFIPDATIGGIGRILGAIVKEEASVPDGALLIGDVAKGYAFNIKQNISVAPEDHVKIRITDYAAYAILDGNVKTTKAFALLTIKEGAVTPTTATFDKTISATGYTDLVFTVANSKIKSLKNGTTTIAATNYTLSNNDKTVTIKKEYLATLDTGTVTINFITSTAADKCSATITVSAS